jgi:uncharacterized membrane-anchored protein
LNSQAIIHATWQRIRYHPEIGAKIAALPFVQVRARWQSLSVQEGGLMTKFRTAAFAVSIMCVAPAFAQAPDNEQQAQAEYVRQTDALGWVHGPATVAISDQAKLQLPKGMRYLDQKDTSKFLRLNGNPPAGRDYTIAPEGPGWFAILEFDPSGYVSDKEKIDPDALFKQLKTNEASDNEERKSLGQTGLHLDRWLAAPHYDAATHNLEWGTVMHSDSGGQIINYTSRILGRNGVTRAILVSDPGNFSADLPQYRTALAGFAYQPDKTYEAHQAGDKVAAYGLGALVAGGAAAAVVKSGLFAGIFAGLLKFGVAFYKLIIVGAVALFAGFRKHIGRLFGRTAPSDGGDAA